MFERNKYYKQKLKQNKDREYMQMLNEHIAELEDENNMLRMQLAANAEIVSAADALTVEHTELIKEMNQMKLEYQRELNKMRALLARTKRDIDLLHDKQLAEVRKKEE